MVDFLKNKIIQGDKEEKIDHFEVWFVGPSGLIPKLPLAIELFQTYCRLNPDERLEFYNMFKSVSVAVCASGLYEVLVT